MEDLKAEFGGMLDKLAVLEVSARRLSNHHLADLIKASHGRLVSAAGHPDVDLLALQLDRDHRDGVHNDADKFPANQGDEPGLFPSDHPSHDAPAFPNTAQTS